MILFFIENQPPVGPRGRNILSYSLQTSPTRNFMDPIDFNNLASSRYNSTENLFNSLPCESTNNSGLSSRWRSSRRSLRSSRRGMYKDCNVKKTTHEIQKVNSISRISFLILQVLENHFMNLLRLKVNAFWMNEKLNYEKGCKDLKKEKWSKFRVFLKNFFFVKLHRKMNYFYEFFQKLIHIAISRIFLHELEIELGKRL